MTKRSNSSIISALVRIGSDGRSASVKVARSARPVGRARTTNDQPPKPAALAAAVAARRLDGLRPTGDAGTPQIGVLQLCLLTTHKVASLPRTLPTLDGIKR